MKPKSAIALRANVVLFCVSVGFASAPLLAAALLFDLPEDSGRELIYEMVVSAVALIIVFVLKRQARRAFEVACDAGLVEVSLTTHYRASISSACRNAWLVQMHVELCGGDVRT